MLGTIAPLETDYNGHHFRSRMEARWAVFFDQCGVEWEYENWPPFEVEPGLWYLPDFRLHNVAGRVNGNLFVEVKGCMGEIDKRKILGLSKKYPVLVLGDLPSYDNILDIDDEVRARAYSNSWGGEPYEFNFETIDGDHFAAHLGVNKQGNFELFGDDSNYLCDRDNFKTEMAYNIAWKSWR